MREIDFATPQEAEEAFYDAFRRCDLDAMMSVWADDESIVCVHPLGPRLQGRAAVEESWREILSVGAPMRFELTDASLTQDAWISVHCLHENILHGPRLERRSRMVVTNVYKLTDTGWRMFVHHASPAERSPVQAEHPSPRIVH